MEDLHATACQVGQTVHLPSPSWKRVRLTLDPAARTSCDKEEDIDSSASDPVHNKRVATRRHRLILLKNRSTGLRDRYGKQCADEPLRLVNPHPRRREGLDRTGRCIALFPLSASFFSVVFPDVATCAVRVFVRLRSSVAVALAYGNRADEQGADARQKDQAEHVAMLPERGGPDFEVEEDVLAEQPGAPGDERQQAQDCR